MGHNDSQRISRSVALLARIGDGLYDDIEFGDGERDLEHDDSGVAARCLYARGR
jgi:hypothetical protein